jgi:hypothetical protein
MIGLAIFFSFKKPINFYLKKNIGLAITLSKKVKMRKGMNENLANIFQSKGKCIST